MDLTDRNYMTGVGFIVFGSIVHVANYYLRSRKKGDSFFVGDAFTLFITSAFSGSVYAMFAILASDNVIHIILSGAIGSFLGVPGLTRATDIILSILARKPL